MSETAAAPRTGTDGASGRRRATRQKPPLSDRARAERRLGILLAAPAFVVMLAVTVYPILQAFFDSLFSYRLTAPDQRSFVGLANYGVLFTDPVFWRDLGVTVLITVVTVAIELVLGFALALVMHNAVKSLRGLLRTAILVPYGTITVVSAFAWFFAFDINTGFVNAWLPVVEDSFNWFGYAAPALTVIMLSEIWKTTPFISLLLLSGLAQVPGELTEAARVDGGTRAEVMRRVVLPNMKAAIMVAVLFRALDAFRIFDNVFIMTNGAYGTEVLSLLAYRTSIGRLEIGMGSAISVVLFLCVIGIAIGAIKGFKVDLASGEGR